MSTFSFTKIAIIESLEPDDFKSGTELGNYLRGLQEDHPGVPNVDLTVVADRIEFLATIEALTVDAENDGEYPILQIETHGWANKTGLPFPDGTSLSWDELAAALARLNKATGFNLVVCVAACFGGHFIGALRPTDPSPCFALIGPTHETDGSELLRSFRALYRTLLLTLDANAALKALHEHRLNEGGFLTTTAEDWFFKLSDGYLRTHCTKERLKERGKAIVAELREEGKTLNSAAQSRISGIGEELAFSFLDRRFPSFFMTDAIPENRERFSNSLFEARRRAQEFFESQV
jgi:hypothetical protein